MRRDLATQVLNADKRAPVSMLREMMQQKRCINYDIPSSVKFKFRFYVQAYSGVHFVCVPHYGNVSFYITTKKGRAVGESLLVERF